MINMANKLELYLKEPRLAVVNELAKTLYDRAGLEVHNYPHALWDTEKIIIIGEAEGHRDISLSIAAGLMHDTGVSRGPYKDHSVNGGKNVREYLPGIGFNPIDIEEIAVAVEEHNGLEHISDTSRYLYDGDTLNKSGSHGLRQCEAVGKEFGLDLTGMTKRFLPYFEKLAQKGFYTDTAREIDREMGNGQLAGLELTLEFWKKSDELLRQGNLNEIEIIKKLKGVLNIEDEC